MGEGRGPSMKGRPASRRLLVLVGALLAVSVVTVLIFQSPTPACHNTRRSIRPSAPLQTLTECVAVPRTCDREPHANVAWLQSREGMAGGAHVCAEFRKVCLDEGVLVTYDEKYNRYNGSQLPTFDVTHLKVCP
jgi:hypothetical protein